MAAAKSACKEKKLAKMSSDLTSACNGINHIVRLNYDIAPPPSAIHRQTVNLD